MLAKKRNALQNRAGLCLHERYRKILSGVELSAYRPQRPGAGFPPMTAGINPRPARSDGLDNVDDSPDARGNSPRNRPRQAPTAPQKLLVWLINLNNDPFKPGFQPPVDPTSRTPLFAPRWNLHLRVSRMVADYQTGEIEMKKTCFRGSSHRFHRQRRNRRHRDLRLQRRMACYLTASRWLCLSSQELPFDRYWRRTNSESRSASASREPCPR